MMVLMNFRVDGWRRVGELSRPMVRPDDKEAAVRENLRTIIIPFCVVW